MIDVAILLCTTRSTDGSFQCSEIIRRQKRPDKAGYRGSCFDLLYSVRQVVQRAGAVMSYDKHSFYLNELAYFIFFKYFSVWVSLLNLIELKISPEIVTGYILLWPGRKGVAPWKKEKRVFCWAQHITEGVRSDVDFGTIIVTCSSSGHTNCSLPCWLTMI
jgi:hypothetical protein